MSNSIEQSNDFVDHLHLYESSKIKSSIFLEKCSGYVPRSINDRTKKINNSISKYKLNYKEEEELRLIKNNRVGEKTLVKVKKIV